jgi:hypothetical protein
LFATGEKCDSQREKLFQKIFVATAEVSFTKRNSQATARLTAGWYRGPDRAGTAAISI